MNLYSLAELELRALNIPAPNIDGGPNRIDSRFVRIVKAADVPSPAPRRIHPESARTRARFDN